jgi:YVTN family beta-propeller protein
VISTATNTVTTTLTVGSYPEGVAVTPNGAYVYVTNSGSGTVSVISSDTNAVTATLTIGNQPEGVAVTPNSAYAYATNYGDNTVSVLNLATTVSAAIPTGTNVEVSLDVVTTVVTLIFPAVTASGQLSVTVTPSYPPPPQNLPSVGTASVSTTSGDPGFFLGVWRVTVTAKYTGPVKIGIYYGNLGGTPSQIYQSEAVPGDVNFDGKVNLADLLIITKALGSTPGTPRWNPNCDLNGDGKVTLQDLGIALQNFGKTGNPAWITIPSTVDIADSIIWGTTTQFSLFGVR